MKNNIFIIFIIITLMLTLAACAQKSVAAEGTPTNSPTPTVSLTPTDTPTPTVTLPPTNTPTLKPGETPTPTELPQPEVSDIPLSKRYDELPGSVAKIFRENGKFGYVETEYPYGSLISGAEYTIEAFQPYISEKTEHPEEWTAVLDSFTIIDLDRDGKNELVCYIKTVLHLQTDYLILSDVDGKAYGYMVAYRAFNPLLADGRVWSSGGAATSDLYRFNAFTANGCVTETLAGSRINYYELADGEVRSELYYELAGGRVSEGLFDAFCDEVLRHGSFAPWTPFDTAENSK